MKLIEIITRDEQEREMYFKYYLQEKGKSDISHGVSYEYCREVLTSHDIIMAFDLPDYVWNKYQEKYE